MRSRTIIPTVLLGLLFHGTSSSQTRVDSLGGASDAAPGGFDLISGNATTDTVVPIPPVGCEYPTGMEANLIKDLHYPESERDAGVEGTVYVQFVVNKQGKVKDVRVIRGVSPGLDAEAVRAVESMPTFTPARMNGKPVNTRYVLPIAFNLPKPEPPSKN